MNILDTYIIITRLKNQVFRVYIFQTATLPKSVIVVPLASPVLRWRSEAVGAYCHTVWPRVYPWAHRSIYSFDFFKISPGGAGIIAPSGGLFLLLK